MSDSNHRIDVSSIIDALSYGAVERHDELGYINYNPEKIPYILVEIVKEAKRSYIFCQYTASIASSAIVVERALFEVIKKETGKRKAEKSNLFSLIELAFAYKKITRTLRDDAHEIRKLRNKYLHANFNRILKNTETYDEFKYGSAYIIASKTDALTTWQKMKSLLEHIYNFE